MLAWKKFQNEKICVAVSGGEDSVALLHYLKALEKSEGFLLSAVHCEHGIRGEESLADMRFVQELCKVWDIPLTVFSADCPALAKSHKLSLETAARNFRGDCFRSLLQAGKVDYIATAHHRNDEAETVLFRMARGSALGGMVAMKEEDGRILRPFLQWSKGEIQAYVQTHALPFRTDSTNLKTDATRNKIRLEILPKLEAAVDGAVDNIARFAALAEEDDRLLRQLSKDLLLDDGERPIVAFSDQKPLFSRACLMAMKRVGLEKDYTSAHLNALFALQSSERGAYLNLPQNIRAEKGTKGIAFSRFEEELFPPLPLPQSFDLEGYDGGRYEVKLFSSPVSGEEKDLKILRLDMDKLPKSACFRFRREGDEIERFGGGTKSLKKFFNEEKIPTKERAYLPLIAEAEGGTVYVVCGVEISEKVKVDGETKRILYIQTKEKEDGKARKR